MSRFGLLTALECTDVPGSRRILCSCLCGTLKVVRNEHLKSGATRSCGCLRAMGHGMAGTPEYNAWSNMIQRCTNPKHPNYDDYGGRGITVCEAWRKFENFYDDMGKSRGLTLERRDNNKGYEPGNCEWATWAEQARNKR